MTSSPSSMPGGGAGSPSWWPERSRCWSPSPFRRTCRRPWPATGLMARPVRSDVSDDHVSSDHVSGDAEPADDPAQAGANPSALHADLARVLLARARADFLGRGRVHTE